MVAYGVSFPFPGINGMTDTDWRAIGSAWGDGIVNAFGAGGTSSFAFVPSASDRTISLHLDEIRIRGVQFRPTQETLTLTIPDVAAGSVRSDRVIARYDPAAANTDKITFLIRAGTPVTTGTPVRPNLTRISGGVWEICLWVIVGGNVAANALDFEDHRLFIGDRLHGLTPPGQNTELNLGRPDGSQYFDWNTKTTWVQTYPGGVATWTNIDDLPWTGVNLPTSLKAGAATPQWRLERGRVFLQGEVQPTTGVWVAGQKALGSVPASIAPKSPRRWAIAVMSPSTNMPFTARAFTDSSGSLYFNVPTDPAGLTVGGASLDGISWPLEG